MIERVKPDWMWLAGAFTLMIAVPWYLLSREPENVPQANPILITHIKAQEIAVIDALVRKPLFNSERTPRNAAAELAEAQMAEAEPPQQVTPAPTLVGLVSKRRGKAVAIVKTNDGKTTTLSTGQSSDGWQLVSIGRNEAVFASASERRTIGLDYGNQAIGGPGEASAPTEPPQQPEIIPDGEPN